MSPLLYMYYIIRSAVLLLGNRHTQEHHPMTRDEASIRKGGGGA